MRSNQTGSDIQTLVLLENIAKWEADLQAGEGVKKELQNAHMEAQSLFITRQELAIQIQQTKEELQKAQLDVQKLPYLNVELDTLTQEHQRLR
ncbi:hypothetical protein C1H46_004234 [Malus baccata]|uniref:Uncharacterized protein n=1 Tax=Malus baccata TaxID=106549 RepID=A0A540NGK8_MALBA|nr:hypothetical protein C1H46_004234 [Malus baccata]